MTSDRRRQESPKANIKGRVDATSPQVGAIAYGLDFGEIEIWEDLTHLAFKLSMSPAGQDPRADIMRRLDSVCTRGSSAS